MGISRENSVGELPSIERSSVSKANESKRRRGKKKIQDRLSILGAPPSLRKDFSLSFNEPVQPSMSLSLTSDGRAATIMSQFYAAQSSKKDFDTSVKGRESPSKDFDETGGNMKLGNMLSSSMFSHSKVRRNETRRDEMRRDGLVYEVSVMYAQFLLIPFLIVCCVVLCCVDGIVL